MSLNDSLKGAVPGIDDALFFSRHRSRMARIRKPMGNEAEEDFRQLGYHDPDRRRLLIWRVPPDGPMPGRLIPIPIVVGFDETIEDDDATLLPMLHKIMAEAAENLGVPVPQFGRG